MHTEPTLAASATISGSSIAVTSFRAGREFATKTTYKTNSLHNLFIRTGKATASKIVEVFVTAGQNVDNYNFVHVDFGCKENNSCPSESVRPDHRCHL